MKKRALGLATLLLAGCHSLSTYEEYFHLKNVPHPSLDAFPHCHGYGCRKQQTLSFTAEDWEKIDQFFENPSQNAQEERQKIAEVIGVFEKKTGFLAGTQDDKRGTFRQIGDDQHDCVDESINATTYLSLLEQRGHLNFHDILPPESRTPLTTMQNGVGWPHQAAAIRERETGDVYIVDSWFHDNGHKAEIIDLQTWRWGWTPRKAEAKAKAKAKAMQK